MNITDICELDNESSIIECLKQRFQTNIIYTYVAKILIAMNPFKQITDLYSEEIINRYRNDVNDELPPHLYSIANRITRRVTLERPQTILFTGETGGGKTMSAMHMLKFLGYSSLSSEIKGRFSTAHSIFELFGNATTCFNQNSSRFSKLTEMYLDSDFKIKFVQFSYLLLESNRVYSRNPNESNFHVFHSCRDLLNPNINLDCTQSSNRPYNISHRRDLNDVDAKLAYIGIPLERRVQMYKLLAAISHLENIELADDVSGKCQISLTSRKHFEHVATLLNIDQQRLERSLLTHSIKINESETITMHLSVSKANRLMNSLAKYLYESLFEDVVCFINASLSSCNQTDNFLKINMLDIAGFESFEKNYFEQMCINYVNEKVQQMFVKLMLKDEEEWYAKECLEIPKIPFLDNSCILNVFDDKTKGIFCILDDSIKMQCQSTENFIGNIFSNWKNHPNITRPKPTSFQDEEFIIRHFAGDVVYNVTNFIEKNQDMVPNGVKDLCQCIDICNRSLDVNYSERKLKGKSATHTLKLQTNELINKLNETECSFVRCVKPNTSQSSDIFDGHLVRSQLVSSCTTAYQRLMRIGFPSHMDINDFFDIFKQYPVYCEATSNIRKDICQELLRACGLRWKDFRIGNTNIFFRNGKRDVITENLDGDIEKIVMRRKKLKFLRFKLRFIIIFIVERCRFIRKTEQIQNVCPDMAVDAGESDNLSIEHCPESQPKLSKKRKLDNKSNVISETNSHRHEPPAKQIESEYSKRTTITIPSVENDGSEERLRVLLRQEKAKNEQLARDYSILQRRYLELKDKLDHFQDENERLIFSLNENNKRI